LIEKMTELPRMLHLTPLSLRRGPDKKPRQREANGRYLAHGAEPLKFRLKRRPPRIGPWSSVFTNGVGATIDRRTREGAFMLDYANALLNHIGGNPSVIQYAIITQCARLALRIALMDESMANHEDAESTYKSYLAWVNTLSRLLIRLGTKTPPKPKINLLEYQKRMDAALGSPKLAAPTTAIRAPQRAPLAPRRVVQLDAAQ
jgi:hypothetical protein